MSEQYRTYASKIYEVMSDLRAMVTELNRRVSVSVALAAQEALVSASELNQAIMAANEYNTQFHGEN
jgi:adenylate cyclase